MSFASTSTEFAMLDSRTGSGAFILPVSSAIPGRILNVKDPYGAFTRSSITVYTAGGDTFEDGTTYRVLNNAFDNMQFYAGSTTMWYVTGGTEQNITTTNISVISTLQTYNWPSLCNNAAGYATQFNPAAVGKISLLDNIFTSSIAGLASTFIEFGNLNAAPVGMNPGGSFRYLMGVEQDGSVGTGLRFKLKQWQSFGMVNSPLNYGANNSTLRDLTTWDNGGNLTHGGNFLLSSLGGVASPASPGAMRITYASGSNYIQFGSTMFGSQTLSAGGALIFGGINGWMEAMRIQTGIAGDPSPGVRVGINCNAPSYILDVNGIGRTGMPVSTLCNVTANVGLTGFGIFYYITNSGFNSLVLPSTDPAAGWFITLRNNTGVTLSVTITGTNSKIPASPFSINPQNSVSLAYDTAPPTGGCNWVYF
jgi:hypothetical protein